MKAVGLIAYLSIQLKNPEKGVERIYHTSLDTPTFVRIPKRELKEHPYTLYYTISVYRGIPKRELKVSFHAMVEDAKVEESRKGS